MKIVIEFSTLKNESTKVVIFSPNFDTHERGFYLLVWEPICVVRTFLMNEMLYFHLNFLNKLISFTFSHKSAILFLFYDYFLGARHQRWRRPRVLTAALGRQGGSCEHSRNAAEQGGEGERNKHGRRHGSTSCSCTWTQADCCGGEFEYLKFSLKKLPIKKSSFFSLFIKEKWYFELKKAFRCFFSNLMNRKNHLFTETSRPKSGRTRDE